jgi:glycerophosphoryl diester phosphodiesterase
MAPIVIAHRGASGYRPEHTLEAYALAIAQGADYIEPDLVITSDGVLVARHENEIGGTTDVAVKFPDRKAVKTIDGQRVEGWFTEDFTLAELRTLRARERLAFRSKAFDGQFLIPTFDEVIALAQRAGQEAGRTIGIYPETKHPSYFRGLGLPLEPPLLDALRRHGWDRQDAPVFIQSFEVGNLRLLNRETDVRLIQLIETDGAPSDFTMLGDPRTYADLLTPEGLDEIAGYADGIGPDKGLILPVGPDGAAGQPTTLVRDAHEAGLLVHAWTFRSEDRYLPRDYLGDPAAEIARFISLGVDGLFADFPDVAVAARDRR